jgi:hypothetical protein
MAQNIISKVKISDTHFTQQPTSERSIYLIMVVAYSSPLISLPLIYLVYHILKKFK